MPDKNNGGLYAIEDRLAGQLLGNDHAIWISKHEAAAIRQFGDVASMPNSLVGRHPEDFDLIRLGYLTDENHLLPIRECVLTGSQWAAAQQRTATQEG